MPNSPSLMGLSNRVSLYRFTGAQDPDAGLATDSYDPAFATAVPCSVQPDEPMRYFDENTGRIAEKTPYDVFFVTDYSLRAHDKIVWVDNTGTTRNLIVFGSANQAGKGAAFVVHAEEQL